MDQREREELLDRLRDACIGKPAKIAWPHRLLHDSIAAIEDQPDSIGIGLIASERNRQVSEEGWTPEHDDTHDNGEMAAAASAYACFSIWTDDQREASKDYPTGTLHHLNWPWSLEWWKPKDRIADLVRAGALIAAEIDRLKRAEKETA